MKKPKTRTEIILPAKAKLEKQTHPSGWGEGYQLLILDDRAVDITVKVGEHAGVSLRISKEGDLIITNYGGMYDTQVPQWRLTNSRPWTEVKA